eukprot:1524771-Pyramimonas_sp.AAC.1
MGPAWAQRPQTAQADEYLARGMAGKMAKSPSALRSDCLNAPKHSNLPSGDGLPGKRMHSGVMWPLTKISMSRASTARCGGHRRAADPVSPRRLRKATDALLARGALAALAAACAPTCAVMFAIAFAASLAAALRLIGDLILLCVARLTRSQRNHLIHALMGNGTL